MRHKPYRKHSNPAEFLQNVINTWTAFCEVNYSLANAIADLLDENARLREKLAEMEKAVARKSND